jgi:hypothetical protein
MPEFKIPRTRESNGSSDSHGDGDHRVTKRGVKATFVELPSPVQIASGECVLEVENAGGAKMRMHLKGVAMPDLAAISRSFWNHQP